MDRTIHVSIEKSYPSIYAWLKENEYPKKIIAQLKQDTTNAKVNHIPAMLRTPLHEGDVLSLAIKETATSSIVPKELPLSMVYEDEDLIVIDKAAGCPVHPSIEHFDDSLANALAAYYDGKHFVFRCINRLDKDTSGLVLIAKNPLSAAFLQRQMKQREIKRTYLAITEGTLPREGTIDAPIAREEGSIIKRTVDREHGERAITHYTSLAYKNGYTLASITLETGRTHQIRVHMSHIGHPLPGDYLYHPGNTVLPRQALHSYRLSFLHPITGDAMEFYSPLPNDLAALIS